MAPKGVRGCHRIIQDAARGAPLPRTSSDHPHDPDTRHAGNLVHAAPSPRVGQDALMDCVMGDTKIAAKILNEFITSMPAGLDSLDRMLEAGDDNGVLTQVHSFKSASASLGGKALSAIALEMEQAARNGDLDSVRTKVPALRAAFAQFKSAVEAG